ncbi:MAG: AMP-binding protein [SAR324 cluster bacterium]|nr:AMP-binding protein [SAR324 cluster bacterium]
MYSILSGRKNWDELTAQFSWNIPERMNIADVTCDRHAEDPDKIAIYYEDEEGNEEVWTFLQIQQKANQLANALEGLGIHQGDRIGILLPQRPETAIAHMAIYKIGAIAIPLASLFGPEALKYRLDDASAVIVIVDEDSVKKIQQVEKDLPELKHVIQVGDSNSEDVKSFQKLIQNGASKYKTKQLPAMTPALVIYTSGTTGNPKGALLAHQCLLGHLTGFELSHDFAPQPDDLFWTPADWAWIGGLMNILLCSWFYGMPVLAYRAKKFDPEKSFTLMHKYRVRNVFMPPTALRMIRQANLSSTPKLQLRSMMSAGESVSAEILKWARETFHVTINEMYGQTEVNYSVGNCQAILPVKPGSMGKPYPGHVVAILDEEGNEVPHGTSGEIAFHKADDPIFFLRYWNNEVGTKQKFIGEWAKSGDQGHMDDEGYIWFEGRNDDVIISAGYRIGPVEIEEQLLKHPSVAMVAVVAKPDDIRGSIIKAFIKPVEEIIPDQSLIQSIQAFVRKTLAAHEYPREIEFIDEFPLTTTGKIIRRRLRDMEEGK